MNFDTNPPYARYFVIKSYNAEDVHKSIKYNVWASTQHGNKRLDQAYRESASKGPIYLFFSVNGSGCFCGMARMVSPVDYTKTFGAWAIDGKWTGQFNVHWIFIKDVPNQRLRHIRLPNNENKPVTNSRDTQEIPQEQGRQVLKIMHSYEHDMSILDDWAWFEENEKKQLREKAEKAAKAAAAKAPAGGAPAQRQAEEDEGEGDN